MTDSSALDHRSRPEMIEEARRHGIERPERMTRAEIKDEILRRTKTGAELSEARGLFGVARSMLASVVESGLNLPDAARLIRGSETFDSGAKQVAPVATVTLAEIYAAQGHKKRALRMLDEVLEQEPDHEVALRVKRQLEDEQEAKPREPGGTDLAPITPEYVPVVAPEALVETTGVEIRTGQPPVVAEVARNIAEEVPAYFSPPVSPASEEEPSNDVPVADLPSTQSTPVDEFTAEPPLVQEQAPVAEPAPVTSAVEVTEDEEPRLALLQTVDGVALYWELTQAALAHGGLEGPDGYPALRVVGFQAQRGAPRREEAVLSLASVFPAQTSGVIRLTQFSLGMPVRAAVGVELGDGFVPLAVGRSLDALAGLSGGFEERARRALT